MAQTPYDPGAKTPENARRQFVELYGSSLTLNAYLKLSLFLSFMLSLGLLGLAYYTAHRYANVRPLVVRIDEVGRAETVQYDATLYKPQPQEMRYFLTQFVVKHFSRLRATIQRDYPASLFFLEPGLADATIGNDERSRVIETFVNTPSAEDVDIVVQNVVLTEISSPPFRAAVNFQKFFYPPGGKTPRSRQTFVAQVVFSFRDDVPNSYVPVNPLGLQVTYFRVDQVFD